MSTLLEKIKSIWELGFVSDSSDRRWSIFWGSLSVFTSILAAAVTFPFLQAQRDALQCDALCYGSLQSARSGFSLIGSVLVGRMSDRMGRHKVLWIGLLASILSCILNRSSTTITHMWIAMIPSSLLNHNYNVLKALFADYTSEVGGSEAERAAAMGRLGMAVGISFMLGPMLGASMLKDYTEATTFGLLLTIFSGAFLLLLPVPRLKRVDSSISIVVNDDGSETEVKKNVHPLLKFVSLPSAQSPGARLLFFMRCFMALAFNVFVTVWTVSLKERFNFGPKDHAMFMGWIGLCYAVSQGVIAKVLIEMVGEDPTSLLLGCVVFLSIGRVFAMFTTSIVMVYAIMAVVIVALGVMNTAMSSACSNLADASQVGGLLGVMESVESLAGLVGPTLGGLLFRVGPHVPLTTVVLLYASVFVAVHLFYKKTIVEHKRNAKASSNVGAAALAASVASKVAQFESESESEKRKKEKSADARKVADASPNTSRRPSPTAVANLLQRSDSDWELGGLSRSRTSTSIKIKVT